MEEIKRRLEEARPRNWESWPTLRRQWPWFVALGAIILLAIPWGIRAEERGLESASRETLASAGFEIQDITFTGRQATIVSTLNTDEQVAAVNALAAMGGVAKVTWVEGTASTVAPTTPPVASTTTTATPQPGSELTLTVAEGRLTLQGAVPAAATIRELNDAAANLWGDDVVNRITFDGTLIAHRWLGDAPAAVGVLTMLIDGQITLDRAGATLTGGATDQADADAAIARLTKVLGPDVMIITKVIVAPLDMPLIEIIAPGDGTISLQGSVADVATRKAIVQTAAKTAEELEVTNKIRPNDTTADSYTVRRIPDLVAALGSADQWTLRVDSDGLGGSATDGKVFKGNKVKPTPQMTEIITLFGRFLEADPTLHITIEIHADDREGNVDSAKLAQKRADAIAAQLVRLGIEPKRVSATAAAGEGELLRFQLTPAEQ